MTRPHLFSLSYVFAIAAVATGCATAPASVAPAPPSASVPAPETASATLDGLPTALTAAAVDAGGAPGTVVTAPVEAPIRFAMVGLELPADADARVRTSTDGQSWSGWVQTERLGGDDGPDAGTSEAEAATDADRHTDALWVGDASWVQVELQGADPADVRASFIDTLGLSGDGGQVSAAAVPEADGDDPSPTYQATAMPGAVTRAGWGADESLRGGAASYATSVRYSVIHHTAGSNSYSEREAPAVVRGIYHYHTSILGWNDVGYNVLVDRYGKIYEGRAGGMERAVIGAHAQGFNTGSIGVSVIRISENPAFISISTASSWPHAAPRPTPPAASETCMQWTRLAT